MRKILTIIPAGEVYKHDCVRWYRAYDIQRSINHYHNIGDAFVHDSSLKLLDYDVVENVDIRSPKQEDIDRYNSEFDYCFIRGSNYINEGMDWYGLPEILDRLKIPVLALGIGAQAPSRRRLILSEQTRRVMDAISHHCATIGVRGAYTAEILAEMGIKNIRVVGCPTLFRRRDPQLRIQLPPLADLQSLGFTLRREVSSTYTSDIKRYIERQRQTILGLAERFALTLLAQGEIEEKKIVFGTQQQRDEAFDTLFTEAWLEGPNDPLTTLYASRLRYSDVVADYDKFVRDLDAVLGYRLHGNLIALANGVPSVYFIYDSRTAEFASTFSIPSYDIYGDQPFVLEDYWDQGRFDAFNGAYQRGYAAMRAFLDENAVAHRLDGASVAASPIGEAARVAVIEPADQGVTAMIIPVEDVEGYIDRIEGQRVSGWAWCRSTPDVMLDIEIRCDDATLTTVRAEKYRADLARGSVGDGHHAFEVVIDQPVAPDQCRRISAHARCGSNGPTVALKNRAVTETEPVRHEEEAPPSADARSPSTDPQQAQVLAAVAAMGAALEQRLVALSTELAMRQPQPAVAIGPHAGLAANVAAEAGGRERSASAGRTASLVAILATLVAVASLLISLSSFILQAGYLHPRTGADPVTASAAAEQYRADR